MPSSSPDSSIPNHSPWIHQLKRTRPIVPLHEDISTDVVIVGGGIAGVTTAFFSLRDTDQRVVLIEADMVAHGATGHNAGQLVSYFERDFPDLVREFGLQLASAGLRDIESTWELVDEIFNEAKLETPLHIFTGQTGFSTIEQLLKHLEMNRLRVEGGLEPEPILVAKEWERKEEIPEIYEGLYALASRKKILAALETTSPHYVASVATKKGCANSALFSEELLGYLIQAYPDRFSFYEGSPMSRVTMKKGGAILEVLGKTITAKKVILCTNGFENFSIINEDGPDIDPTFHHGIAGRIGYMTGYTERDHATPNAISYYPAEIAGIGDPTGDTYFYLTRRPHEDGGEKFNLVCAGGPESVLPNHAVYSRTDGCHPSMRGIIDDFLRDNYKKYPSDNIEYTFCWHGLMGYTPNGVRRIGAEPRNTSLLYNLGCNGVGILPSIYGGKRIADILAGKHRERSMFDPVLELIEIIQNPFRTTS